MLLITRRLATGLLLAPIGGIRFAAAAPDATARITFILVNDIYLMADELMADGQRRGGFALKRVAAYLGAYGAKDWWLGPAAPSAGNAVTVILRGQPCKGGQCGPGQEGATADQSAHSGRADVCQTRGITTAQGGKWHTAQVFSGEGAALGHSEARSTLDGLDLVDSPHPLYSHEDLLIYPSHSRWMLQEYPRFVVPSPVPAFQASSLLADAELL